MFVWLLAWGVSWLTRLLMPLYLRAMEQSEETRERILAQRAEEVGP